MKSSFLESSPRDLQVTANRRVQGRRTFVAAVVDGASRCRARGETRYDETTPEIVSTSKNSKHNLDRGAREEKTLIVLRRVSKDTQRDAAVAGD